MAPRSRQVMLSYPSSLQSHSDFPTPITAILPVSPDLVAAYRRRSPAETLGSQVLPPLSVTACRWLYPGSPSSAYALCFLDGDGLLPDYRGSARIFVYEVCPSVGLSQLSPSNRHLRGCTIRFMLRPAVLASTPDWVRPALCEPSRYRVGASSARVLPHKPALCLLIQKGN
jgi:hypothetical protein